MDEERPLFGHGLIRHASIGPLHAIRARENWRRSLVGERPPAVHPAVKPYRVLVQAPDVRLMSFQIVGLLMQRTMLRLERTVFVLELQTFAQELVSGLAHNRAFRSESDD